MGTESGSYPNEDAVNHFIIGGKLYIDMLDHTAGVLTADSALIVDSSKKINELNIDNLNIDGNTISSTDTNGDIVLDPNGTGQVNVSGAIVAGVGTPTAADHAVNKAYADALSSGVDIKGSCRVATTANITLSGAQTIDGISVIAGDRVLVKNQGTPSQNGLYVCASGAWARTADADTSIEVTSGLFTFIEEGTVSAGVGYVLTTANPITLGSTGLVFTQFSAAGSVSGTTNRITVTAGVVDISALYVGQTSIITLGTVTTGTWNASLITAPYGGTGLSSYTAGDILYYSSGTALSKLGIGANYQFLKVVGGVPAWGEIDGGTF